VRSRNFDARKFARDHGMGTDENYPDGLVYFRSQCAPRARGTTGAGAMGVTLCRRA
jgi:hypothetical protein